MPEVRFQSNYMYGKINRADHRSATFRNFFSRWAASNQHESQAERKKGKKGKKKPRAPRVVGKIVPVFVVTFPAV